MALTLNEEQRLLRETAREFLGANAPVTALRALRDARDPLGYSRDLWAQMAGLGWAGIIIPEEFGGLDFGFAGLGAVLEETGRTLAASPLFATCVLGASAVLLAGSQAQKEAVLPRVACRRAVPRAGAGGIASPRPARRAPRGDAPRRGLSAERIQAVRAGRPQRRPAGGGRPQQRHRRRVPTASACSWWTRTRPASSAGARC